VPTRDVRGTLALRVATIAFVGDVMAASTWSIMSF
jgi:hypothetical protein